MTSTELREFYSAKLDRATAQCREEAIDCVLLSSGAELQLLTGIQCSTHERFHALVLSPDKRIFIAPAVDAKSLDHNLLAALHIELAPWKDGEDPYALIQQRLFTQQSPRTIAVAPGLEALHLLRLEQHFPQARFLAADVALAELFVVKEELEIAELTRAGRAIDEVHAQVPALLQPGRTEAEVAADIRELILIRHSVVDFIIVGSGPNGANPHHSYSDRVLESGDIVVVDIGGTLDSGYHSDCTRTYLVGASEHADQQALKAIAVLQQAQEAAVAAVRPGVQAQDIDAAARDIIEQAGYGDYFIHRTGHGIGLSTHEEPYIIAGNDLVLRPGMCFSVEPGIYVPGKFGARIEDIVTVTDNGVRTLNNQPRALTQG